MSGCIVAENVICVHACVEKIVYEIVRRKGCT